MSFFKKVMTFFSTIWNAILWRKHDKKAKKTAPSEEQDSTENDSHLISEPEKLFVDVPLHPAEASGWSEQELSTNDEIPDILIPIVALNIEPPVADEGIQRNSPRINIFGFEDDAPSSLTFFSEPIPAAEAQSASDTLENNVLHAERKMSRIEQDRFDELAQLDQLIPTKYPISITQDDSRDEKIVAELNDMASEVHSPETPLISNLKANLSVESLTSTDYVAAHKKSRINPDLNVLSFCDEMHLFDHDSEQFNFPNDAEGDELKETVLTLGENESISLQKSFTAEDVKINENVANSTCEAVVLVRASVSDTQSLPEANKQESDSKYSTNYMVKSDSLVNFLPGGGSHHNLNDIRDLLESTTKLIALEGPKTAIVKEDCLEEIMCTPRGILKLSGDHLVDYTEEKDSKQISMNTVDELMNVDEPLRRTYHLEGFQFEETSLQPDTNEPIFQKMSNDDLDSELVGSLTAMTDDVESKPVSGSIIHDLKSPINAKHHEIELKEQELDEYKDSENSKSCKLSEFTALCVDESDKMGHIKGNDPSTPEVPGLSFGESPKRNAPVDFDPPGRDKGSSSVALKDALDSTDDSHKVLLAGPSWQLTVPSLLGSEEDAETISHQLNSFLGPRSPILGIDKSRDPIEGCHQRRIDEDIDDFHPFIDCSHLLRIPKEIRKETSFNPCVGAAPSLRSCYKFIPNEPDMYENEDAGYESKYSTMSSMRSDFNGPVSSMNSSAQTEYKNPPISNLSDRYHIGSWGPFPNVIHPVHQQQATVGYPMSCEDNYYEEELNVMSTVPYENAQTSICNPEGFGFINSYGAVEFPILHIPLCVPQPQPTFMASTLQPTIFPLGPFNTPNENLRPLANLEASMHNEQYSSPEIWRGYSANAHLMNEENGEITLMGEGRGLAPITENGSCTGTNYEDDDNHIPDPYFQSLADNNSLHTVKSKADSYSGSLFCESLRSLISHTTESDNVYPSFSCSSVQGCCPSVVAQSCETTLSNDSLPSVIVEETKYSKSVDEDYLATEKFMNDVNSALNESVLDQIQCRLELRSNHLGRGDCSLPGSLEGGEHHVEIPENDVMLRNTLGENISINNSKLTLLDGVLGGGSQQDPVQNLSELDGGSSSSTDYCRKMLESLIENVITSLNGQSSVDGSVNGGVVDTDCGDNHDGGLLENRERDFIVQNMMFIEGVHDQVMEIWNKGSRDKEKAVLEITSEKAARALEISETIVDSLQAMSVNDVPHRRGRRNRRRKKKSNDSEVEPEPSAEVTESIGDGITQDPPIKPSRDTMEESSSTSKRDESAIPKSDGEQLDDGTTRESPKCGNLETDGDEHLDEDDKPGDSSSPSNCKRRRNRRRKRKN